MFLHHNVQAFCKLCPCTGKNAPVKGILPVFLGILLLYRCISPCVEYFLLVKGIFPLCRENSH